MLKSLMSTLCLAGSVLLLTEATAQASTKTTQRTHRIEAGDTLSQIAVDYDCTVRELQALNAMGDSTLIIAGKTLRLPGTSFPRSGKVSRSAPRTSGSQSIGAAWRGRLVGAVQLPHDPTWYRRRIELSYATRETIEQISSAMKQVRRKHPKVHRLAVGDLSSKHGGRLSGHRSHQSGRDVDLGLYFERRPSGYPQRFVEAKDGRLALGPMWTLIEALARTSGREGGAQYVFLDYELQKRIYRYARQRGVSKSRLRPIFQYPDGRGVKDRLVRHEPNHSDHLHVRFACPRGDGRCE